MYGQQLARITQSFTISELYLCDKDIGGLSPCHRHHYLIDVAFYVLVDRIVVHPIITSAPALRIIFHNCAFTHSPWKSYLAPVDP